MDKNFNIQKFASKEEALSVLKSDINVNNFAKIPAVFLDDISFVKQMLNYCPNFYSSLPFELKTNKELYLQAANSATWQFICYAPFSLKNDLDVIKAEAKKCGYFLTYWDYMILFCLLSSDPSLVSLFNQNHFKSLSKEKALFCRVQNEKIKLPQKENINNLSLTELKKELKKERLKYLQSFKNLFKEPFSYKKKDELINKYLNKDCQFTILYTPACSDWCHEKGLISTLEFLKEEYNKNIRHREAFLSENHKGSYPEAFVSALLNNLGIEYKKEKIFNWSKDILDNGRKTFKRYDFYIEHSNAIIEVHGLQHYEKGFEAIGGRTLAQEKQNDKLKQKLALENGIKNYIVINASVSNFEFIKNSIVNNLDFCKSFNIVDVDWNKVHETIFYNPNEQVPLPFYDMEQEYLKGWIETIEEDKRKHPEDYIAKKQEKEDVNGPDLITDKDFPISENNLLPNEQLLLVHLRRNINQKYTDFSKDLKIAGILKPHNCIQNLIKKDLVRLETNLEYLNRITKKDLKEILANSEFVKTSTKQDLINKIFEEYSESELNNIIDNRRYIITSKGEEELENAFIFKVLTVRWETASPDTFEEFKQLVLDVKNHRHDKLIKEADERHKSSLRSSLNKYNKKKEEESKLSDDENKQVFQVQEDNTVDNTDTLYSTEVRIDDKNQEFANNAIEKEGLTFEEKKSFKQHFKEFLIFSQWMFAVLLLVVTIYSIINNAYPLKIALIKYTLMTILGMILLPNISRKIIIKLNFKKHKNIKIILLYCCLFSFGIIFGTENFSFGNFIGFIFMPLIMFPLLLLQMGPLYLLYKGVVHIIKNTKLSEITDKFKTKCRALNYSKTDILAGILTVITILLIILCFKYILALAILFAFFFVFGLYKLFL